MDITIRKWNIEGKCVGILKGHTSSVCCLTVWNNHLYSGSYDKTIRKWNLKGECIEIIKGHEDAVRKLYREEILKKYKVKSKGCSGCGVKCWKEIIKQGEDGKEMYYMQ